MLPVARWFLEEPGGVSSLGPLALHTCCQVWGGAGICQAKGSSQTSAGPLVPWASMRATSSGSPFL